MRHFIFGEYIDLPGNITIAEAKDFFRRQSMRERVTKFAEVPVDEVISLLERVGRRLTEPGPYRDTIMDSMLNVTGYSVPMLEKGMEALEGLLSRKALEDRLACIGDRRALDGWTISQGSPVRALPLGSVCHVSPGNIFLGSVDSLVLGMITKNVNVLKLSRQDPVFPFIFLEALLEEDRSGEIASTLAITSWNHSDDEVMEFVGREFDGILLFGSEEAVLGYKKVTSSGVRLMAYGPKLSWGLIREGLTDKELDSAVKGFAQDVVLWEQRACTSCQNLFVEGEKLARKVAGMLHAEFQSAELSLPQGRMTMDEGVDIRKERERTFWSSFEGERRLFEGRTHTVILEDGSDVTPSPLNRTLYVKNLKDWRDLLKGNLSFMADRMSTVGLAVPGPLMDETMRGLDPLGIPRFCMPGTMGLGADGKGTHDGTYIVQELVKLVNREDISMDRLGRYYDDQTKRDRRTLAELNRLLEIAMKSPFYRELYKDVKFPIESLDDFGRLPVLEKSHLEEHCPPLDNSMLTDFPEGSYIFCTGGTSGVPRRLYWTKEEFNQALHVLGQGFRALGITSKDRVANIMKAGSLYTGFLAVNGGLEQTGCEILSMTANQSLDDTLDLIEDLSPNVAMGMTSTLVELAERSRMLGREIHFDRVFYTGEAMSDTSRALVYEVFKPERVGSLSYGAVEIGTLGFQCECCRHDEFHLAEDWAYMEFGEDGEVFATGTDRLLHPIIRYRMGDRAQWVEDPCSCGRTTPRFRLLGRVDYYVRLLYNDLFMIEIDRALSRFPDLTSAYQVTVKDEGEGIHVWLVIEGQSSEGLSERFWAALKEEAAEFSHLSDFGCPLEVEIVKPGSISRVGRTGKIRRIVDLRTSH